jgi:hypothetical protein
MKEVRGKIIGKEIMAEFLRIMSFFIVQIVDTIRSPFFEI